MNALIKILLAALAAVVLVLAAIALAVAFVFEPNDYRPFLVDSVRDATGREFALDGDLELKLFPCCGVRIGSAVLGNPPGFPEEAFASVESASVSVKIWPLLTRREIQVGTVTLDGANVNLTELPDGRANWVFESTETTAPAAEQGDSPIASLAIEGLKISNGSVAYSGADGTRYSAHDILVDTGAIGGDAAVPVAVKLTARDETADAAADLELVGTLHYDTAAGTGRLDGLDTTVSLPGTRLRVLGNVVLAGEAVTGDGEFSIPEGDLRQLLEALPEAAYLPASERALRRLAGEGRWALTKTSASISGLSLTLDDSTITGNAGVTSFDTGAMTASLDIDRLNLDDYLPREPAAPQPAGTAEPIEVPFDALAGTLLDADVRIAELSARGIQLQGLDARVTNDGRALSFLLDTGLTGGRVKLNGSGSPAGTSPALVGRLELSGISPRALLAALGESVETANPDALTRLSGSTRWQLGRRTLSLEEMSWQLDDTRLTGEVGIDSFDAPATRFELAVDRLNLDDYLAPETETAEDAEDVELPVEMIRGLNVDGRLKAATLRVMNLDLTNLAASVSAKNGVLKFEPLTASLYGGAYQGTVVIDATGAKSRLNVDQKLSAVQVGQLLDALVGSDRLSGALTLNLTGSGEGNTSTELLQGLTGNFGFNLSEGIYHGMDIAYEIENAQSLLKRTAAPERPNRKETPIQALSFSGQMLDGVLGSDDLSAEIPYLKLGGKGGVNLIERTLDYQLNAQVLRTADDATGSRLRGLGGSIIPLTIRGPMAEPRVGVNLQDLVVETVKEKARDALLKRLGLDQAEPPPGPDAGATSPADSQTGAGEAPSQGAPAETSPEPAAAQEEKPAEPPAARDLIERGLRDLLRRPEADDAEEN